MEKEHQPQLSVTESNTSKEALVTSDQFERCVRQSESVENHPKQHAKRFWLVELWVENRELFKEFVKHALLLILLLASLESLNRLLRLSSLAPHELNLFGKLHFYMSAMILFIFALSFIIKVLESEFGGDKK